MIDFSGWGDEALRAGFGFLVCWPALGACRWLRLTAGQTAAALTIYMVPMWRLYALLAGWLA